MRADETFRKTKYLPGISCLFQLDRQAVDLHWYVNKISHARYNRLLYLLLFSSLVISLWSMLIYSGRFTLVSTTCTVFLYFQFVSAILFTLDILTIFLISVSTLCQTLQQMIRWRFAKCRCRPIVSTFRFPLIFS